MRSQNEQQYPIESGDYRELQLLSAVDSSSDVTQRQLSQRVGIALGLTNVLMRNLVQKGYIRASQAHWKRWLYALTPEGLTHKIRLTTAYIHRVLDHYQRVRQTLREQLEPLALHEESRIAIYGTGEFAELVYLGLRDRGIEEIDVFSATNWEEEKFLGLPVRDLAALQHGEYDHVLVASLVGYGEDRAVLELHGVSSDQIITFFSNGNTGRM